MGKVSACVREKESIGKASVCLCLRDDKGKVSACVCYKERKCVCVFERDGARERERQKNVDHRWFNLSYYLPLKALEIMRVICKPVDFLWKQKTRRIMLGCLTLSPSMQKFVATIIT